MELGAKRPDRAAVLCQEILVLEDVLDAGAKPAGASGTRQFAATCADGGAAANAAAGAHVGAGFGASKGRRSIECFRTTCVASARRR